MTQAKNFSSELKALLPELKALEKKASGKLTKDESDALEKPTENVLVEPLLNIFEYNTKSVTDPNRAESQYKIGAGKVDFALLKDGKLVILIEVKRVGDKLGEKHHSQLKSYFNGTDQHESPKFGVLTNGNRYDFYTSKGAKIDSKPCFTFTLKSDCDNQDKIDKLSEILGKVNEEVAKNERLYTNTKAFIESIITESKDEEDDQIIYDFARDGILGVAKANKNPLHGEGKIMPKDIENTKKLVVKIFDDIITDRVNQQWDDMKDSRNKADSTAQEKTGVTNLVDAEREALTIIKAISSQIENLDAENIRYKDYASACRIYFEGTGIGGHKNGHICTLENFDNSKGKYKIRFPDDEVITIDEVSELGRYSEKILDVLKTILRLNLKPLL